MPKCGKSTIGRYVSKQYETAFVDTDQLLKKQHQMTPRELYKQYGEESFREKEEAIIESLKVKKNAIISLGGGALESERNRELLLSLGTIVYLQVDKELLKKRLKKHDPIFIDPIQFDSSFEALWEKRIPVFEKTAHLKIDVTHITKEEIAATIVDFCASLSFLS